MAGKRRRRLGRRLPLRRAAAEPRNWADLSRDVLTLIFRKVGLIDVLWRAQAVCRAWRQLALDPHFWRIIDLRARSDLFYQIAAGEYDRYTFDDTVRAAVDCAARIAVDRSGGCIEEFYSDYFGSDALLSYIAYRSTGLKRLVLISTSGLSGEWLAESIGRFPLLEELQLTSCPKGLFLCRDVGQACLELKCFRLNGRWFEMNADDSDDDDCVDYLNDEAYQIADSMPQLLELQLIGNEMTNKGLHKILDKCLHLESLDIRACFSVNVDAGLRMKLARIKNVKLPSDSTADYEFETGKGGDHGWTICPGYKFEYNYSDISSSSDEDML